MNGWAEYSVSHKIVFSICENLQKFPGVDIILSGEKSKDIIEWCLCVERTNWSEFYGVRYRELL